MFRQKLFLNANTCSWLSKFSDKSSLSTRTTVLYLCTAAVGSPSAPPTRPDLQNLREFGRPYFMQYLLDNPHKYSVVNTDQINVEDETNFESLKLLKTFLDNSEKTEIPAHLLNYLIGEFEVCGMDEIYKFIKFFANYGNSTNMSVPLNHFNETLMKRNFPDEDTLKILWVIKESLLKSASRVEFKFYTKAVMKLCFKIIRLNSQQVAELFLHIPKCHVEFLRKVKFPMQEKLVGTIPELNAEEFAILADGYSRSGMPFTQPELPCVIIDKAIKEIENMHDLHLSKVSKLLENKLKYQNVPNLLDFQEKILPHISSFGEATLLRLILTGVELRCIHKSLWEFAADIFKKKMDNLKCNDLERLLYATTIYNIHDEELLSLAIKHFREKPHVKYPYTLIKFLCHLAHHKLYPEDLLGIVLSKSFISQFNPQLFPFSLKYKYSFLNCCVEIDKPDCNLYFLNEEHRKALFKVFKIRAKTSAPLKNCYESLRKIMNVLEDLYGENTVCEANCLPHYENGIVMKFDKSLKAHTFETKSENYFYAKEAVNDLFSLFIMVVPMTDFSYDKGTLILPALTRVRQLRALGYKPVMIKSLEWAVQRKEQNEFNFIKNLINENLKDLS